MVYYRARDLKRRKDVSFLCRFCLGFFMPNSVSWGQLSFVECLSWLRDEEAKYYPITFTPDLESQSETSWQTRRRRQTRPWRFRVIPGHTSAWWGNFAAQVGCNHFKIDIMFAYSCGRAKTIRKRYRVEGYIFENGEKNLRFHTKTDTCGRGFTFSISKAQK